MSQLNSTEIQDSPVTDTNTKTQADICVDIEDLQASIIWIMVFPAIGIVILLSFFKRRKKLGLDKCWGRPHLVYPVNLIDERPVEFDDEEWMKKYGWCKVFVAILNTAMLVMVYYPFLVCISMRRMILANLLGLLYLSPWLWFFVTVWQLCPAWSQADKTMELYVILTQLLPDIPVVIAFLSLIVAYIYDLGKNIHKLCLKNKQIKEHEKQKSYKYSSISLAVVYTKELMKKVPKDLPDSIKEKVKYHATYDRLKGFKYSPRLLCTMAVAFVGLLKLALEFTINIEIVYRYLILVYTELGPLVEAFNPNLTSSYEFYREFLYIAKCSAFIGTWISFALQVLFMVHMVIMYRIKLHNGCVSLVQFHFGICVPVVILGLAVYSLRYSGYQVAYLVYGFIILTGILALLSFLFGVLICLPIKYRYRNFVVNIIIEYWPTLLITIIILGLQKMLAKFILLMDYGEYLALDNRRFYHILSLFVFFYNFLLGLFSCLRRILLSAIFGVILISRLDCCIYMRGFEQYDLGFGAYLGMLEVDVAHNNPVMKTFIHILYEAISKEKHENNIYNESDKESSLEKGKNISRNPDEIPMKTQKKSKRWRNKWWKAITLINNPCLHLDLLKQEVKQRAKDKKKKAKNIIVDGAATVVSGAIVGSAVGEVLQ